MMEMITSYDGTQIAYHRRGNGFPLVLVPGTGAANPVAWPVVPELEKHFTIYAMDRRGHGMSGDSSTYSLEREFEDTAALVDSIGPAFLLGHSFGGLCALEAALRSPNVRKLVVYEWTPIIRPEEPAYPHGFLDRLDALLQTGDREGVLAAHYIQNAGLTPEQLEHFKISPAWPERLAIAHTVPRELRSEEQYRFDASRFKYLKTPTLLLLGGSSPDLVKESAELIHNTLPHSRIAVMPGHEHIAMYTAPELFLRELLAFLNESH